MTSNGFTVQAIRVDATTGEIVVDIVRFVLRNHGDEKPRIAGDLEVRYKDIDDVPFTLGERVEIAVSPVASLNA